MTRSAIEVLRGRERSGWARVMMVGGMPMPWWTVRCRAVAGTLANVDDEDDHADHPRRAGDSRRAGWVQSRESSATAFLACMSCWRYPVGWLTSLLHALVAWTGSAARWVHWAPGRDLIGTWPSASIQVCPPVGLVSSIPERGN